jgi:hypothetical protein
MKNLRIHSADDNSHRSISRTKHSKRNGRPKMMPIAELSSQQSNGNKIRQKGKNATTKNAACPNHAKLGPVHYFKQTFELCLFVRTWHPSRASSKILHNAREFSTRLLPFRLCDSRSHLSLTETKKEKKKKKKKIVEETHAKRKRRRSTKLAFATRMVKSTTKWKKAKLRRGSKTIAGQRKRHLKPV